MELSTHADANSVTVSFSITVSFAVAVTVSFAIADANSDSDSNMVSQPNQCRLKHLWHISAMYGDPEGGCEFHGEYKLDCQQ